MIGGSDIVISRPGSVGPETLDLVVRSVRERWAEAVVQDGESGQVFECFAAIPFGHVRELFVYRDLVACRSWGSRGAVPDNANSMVHMIMDEGELTLVVDDPAEPTMASIIAEAKQLVEPVKWGLRTWPWKTAA